jgi:hypothetical protein
MVKQAGFLENITQGAFMRRDENPLVAVLPDFIVDLDKTLPGLFQTGDATQAVVLPEPE